LQSEGASIEPEARRRASRGVQPFSSSYIPDAESWVKAQPEKGDAHAKGKLKLLESMK
jgi:hypothetical protein